MKKKFFTIALTFALTACVTACTYTEPTPSGPLTPGQEEQPGETPSEEPFTVSLKADGEAFIPETAISAQWTDGVSYFSAAFDETGVASCAGLDGDYRVTISALPDGYTYDPNGYTATNDRKDITIELFSVTEFIDGGTQWYNNQNVIVTEGAYRAEIVQSRAQEGILFAFEPKVSGTYVIESLVDTAANDVNPILDYYTDNKSYRIYKGTINGGGNSSTYTKNFKYTVNLSSESLGTSYGFAVRADSRDGAFPVIVDFIVTRIGDYASEQKAAADTVVPTEDFANGKYNVNGIFSNYSDLTWTYADNDGLLDGSYYAIRPDDGYYYRVDPDTGEYLYVLCAKISQKTIVIDKAFSELEGGSGDRSIRGVYSIGDKDYGNFISVYAAHCNTDGVYPVTKELKDFLQGYAVKNALFMDGRGWAEYWYDAAEDDQWLFACGYYC